MKKLLTVFTAAVMALAALTSCGAASSASTAASVSKSAVTSAAASASATGKTAFKVGLIQYVEHPSLDEIRAAIVAQLETKAAAEGLTIDVSYQNAQGDAATINSICQQFVSDGDDLIIAIATPTAQGAAAAVDGKDIPVIFSAVTDAVSAGLVNSVEVPGGNITGTSDMIPVNQIFDLAAELTPDVKSYGLIYNTSESNSVSVIEQTKKYLDDNNITYVESAITTSADVQTAAQNLLSKCDAIFAPIDNTVATAMSVLADEAIKAGKPVYVSADSMVADGGLATVGINYTNLGTQTADMALKVLMGAKAGTLPVEVLKEYSVAVNAETAKAIGVDVSKYAK